MNEEKKPPVYPHLHINNAAKLVIHYMTGVKQQVFFEERKLAENAVSWIGHELGKTPKHEIVDLK